MCGDSVSGDCRCCVAERRGSEDREGGFRRCRFGEFGLGGLEMEDLVLEGLVLEDWEELGLEGSDLDLDDWDLEEWCWNPILGIIYDGAVEATVLL